MGGSLPAQPACGPARSAPAMPCSTTTDALMTTTCPPPADETDAELLAQARAAIRQPLEQPAERQQLQDRKSTRLNSSHPSISYAVFCLKKKKKKKKQEI